MTIWKINKRSAAYYGASFLVIVAVTGGITFAVQWMSGAPERDAMHRKTVALQQQVSADAKIALAEAAVYEHRSELQKLMYGISFEDGLRAGRGYVDGACAKANDCESAQFALAAETIQLVQVHEMVRILATKAQLIEAAATAASINGFSPTRK